MLPEKMDLLIDDGSHMLRPAKDCFFTLFERIRPGGWYCIEDWGAGYWESFGGPDQGIHRLLYEIIDEIAMPDRMKPEAGRFRIEANRILPIGEMRVIGAEPIAFIRRK